PKRQLYAGAGGYLARRPVDVILATGEPFVLFKYGSQLSREFGIPWVADYRDAWTQDMRRTRSRLSGSWNAHLETSITKNVSAVTTVSEFIRGQIASLIPNTPIYIVSNGYDPEAMLRGTQTKQTSEVFTI